MGTHSYRNPLIAVEYDEWTWCLRCERVYRTELWEANHWLCPSESCSAQPYDAHRWAPDDWPRTLHPDYPPVPIEGRRYPRRLSIAAH